jgi:hypothetical protein
MKSEACSRFGAKIAEHNSATGEILLNGAPFGTLRLTPDRERSRDALGVAAGVEGPDRHCHARLAAGVNPLQQPQPPQFSEHILTIASSPAGGEQEAAVAIAQHETSSAVQRAAASPSPALAPGVAECTCDVGGVHDALSEAVEWSRSMGEAASTTWLSIPSLSKTR